MIKKKLVQQAVDILRDLNHKFYEDSSKKKPLLEDQNQSTLFLQVTLKKIPDNKSIKMIKVHLPHPLLKDSDEVCLIMGDQDKKNHKAEIEPDILHYKQLLEKHGITRISEVMTLRQLRTDYKPYEAKQKLLAAYNMFLTDKKIAECLPRVLGKHFFKKRKYPIQIDMKHSNLKQVIEKAVSTKVFSITGHGNSCCSEVAYLDMGDKEILDNIKTVAKTLSNELPGLWNNVMGVYLKTAKSKAIPLYLSYGNSSEIHLEDEVIGDVVMDELSTIPHLKVKVYSDGHVKTLRLDEELENEHFEIENTKPEELGESGKEAKTSKGTKKKRGKMESALAESDQLNSDKILGKMLTDSSLEIVISDTEQTSEQGLVKGTKKGKKGLTKMELPLSNDSENENTTVIQSKKKMEKGCSLRKNSEVNSQKTAKETKKLKKGKKGLTEMELISISDSGDDSITVSHRKKEKKIEKCSSEKNSEVNSRELVKETKKSKRAKKGLTAVGLVLPASNGSESESITVIQSKKKKSECSASSVGFSRKKTPGEKISKLSKRKRTDSEAAPVDHGEAQYETPMQTLKKRKIEGLVMKRDNAKKKETLKSQKKKKGNNPRNKI